MPFPFRFALVLWCFAEVLAFVLVVQAIGFGGAVLATVATSMVGFALLRRRGAAALIKLRASFRGRLAGAGGGVVAEALGVLGALALLLPGFLSDLVGAALSVPPLRARAAAMIARRGGTVLRGAPGPSGGVVDLEPAEWQRTDGQSAPRLRR